MTCSPFDLKDYLVRELPAAEARQVEQHLASCGDCREEFERLRVMQTALLTLADEEPPRRIAFVSDKVFEPRWWQRWQWAPGLGFASILLLSVSILVHAFVRPAPVGVSPAELQARVEAEVSKRVAAAPVARVSEAPAPVRINEEVTRRVVAAVAEVRSTDRAEMLKLVSAAEQKSELQRRADRMSFEENFDYLRKQIGQYRRASADMGGLR